MSKLLDIANARRAVGNQLNRYSAANPYTSSSRDALSDGDDRGRGYYNGQVGTRTEQIALAKWQAQNKYSPTRPYSIADTN
jgi:hypothetical protein